MPLELRIPAVGESISEVQIGDWLKQEGQGVRKDELVVRIESEKATVDLPSPADGVLGKILKARGQMARVGEVIATLETGAAPAVPADPATGAANATNPGPSTGDTKPAGRTGSTVMPAARRILDEAGVPAETVAGSGPGGRVTKEDALKAVAASRPNPSVEVVPTTPAGTPIPAPAIDVAPTPAGMPPGGSVAPSVALDAEDEVVPMSPLRRTVARRLVEAQNSMAMLTTFNEIDMSAVQSLRREFQEAFSARHGVKLGFMSFFVKAVIDALKRTPQLNAEIRDQNIVYHHSYDIGVAIGGGKGLVVPVLRQAERLGFAEIEKAVADFGVRAKEARIRPEELQGGTFTITNGGVYGSLLSTPIINPPQSGILGMHAIQDRAVVVGGQIVVRPMMYVALTYDHRIVDGREAVTFLKRVKEVVESPARMLIEA